MPTGSIPKVRAEMRSYALETSDDALRDKLLDWSDRLCRARHKERRGPVRRRSIASLTVDERREIIRLALQGQANHEIGRKFNLDGGRISEILAEENP